MSDAMKFDTGKPQLQWLPYESLTDLANVMEFGANKYQQNNWKKGLPFSRMIGAALRHLYKRMSGHILDEESGLPHLAHAGVCILFLLYYEKHHPHLDDTVGG